MYWQKERLTRNETPPCTRLVRAMQCQDSVLAQVVRPYLIGLRIGETIPQFGTFIRDETRLLLGLAFGLQRCIGVER